ncbi:MATH domain containing protein [Tritrichomonas foetus]|uniref:MATH domain containing protein n=1 Tax=Tritrichomonas foetus TaxID=1144522 RepID=A0A1J4JXS5_9EUKA|nr:MATH domain containing protein [Tritrichomonas foetus]|eukprot:OHT03482.1 MATH domain containing protein [Tritrichomonas foetus]
MRRRESRQRNDQELQRRPSICCICHKVPKHTQILPCCKCITCKKCLINWLENNNICPHCATQLRRAKSKAPLCEAHQKKLEYYCQTCNQMLCSDCLFEQLKEDNRKHANHQIIKASELENSSKIQLKSHLEELKNLHDKTCKQIVCLQNQITSLPNNKEDISYQSHAAFRVLHDHLDIQYKQKQKPYKEATDFLENQVVKYQTLLEEGELILTSDDPKIVPVAQEYINKIKAMNDEIKPFQLESPSKEWVNEYIPKYETIEVQVDKYKKHYEKFKKMKENDNRFLYSASKNLFGGIWRAKIYPNGNQSAYNTHISVYVELLKGVDPPAAFDYQVEIVAAKEKTNNIVRKYTSNFEPMDSWGWNKMAPINTILEKYVDENDVMTLKISIRPESYKVYSQQSKNEYEQIREKYRRLKKEMLNSGDNNKKVERVTEEE